VSPQFLEAFRRLRESELRCPNCGAMNTPGATPLVTLEPDGRAGCDQCGHDWHVEV